MSENNVITSDIGVENFIKSQDKDERLIYLYKSAIKDVEENCNWYWTKIKTKRKLAFTILSAVFVFLIIGTCIQILTSVTNTEPTEKLLYTHIALCCFALATICLLVDKVFGWTTGWVRYVKTVTSMDNIYKEFLSSWTTYYFKHSESLNPDDVEWLCESIKKLRMSIAKLRSDETQAWAVQFGDALSQLSALAREKDKVKQKEIDEMKIKNSEMSRTVGWLNIKFSFPLEIAPYALKINIDNISHDLLGTAWTSEDLNKGKHLLTICKASQPDQPFYREKFFIAPGKILEKHINAIK